MEIGGKTEFESPMIFCRPNERNLGGSENHLLSRLVYPQPNIVFTVLYLCNVIGGDFYFYDYTLTVLYL